MIARRRCLLPGHRPNMTIPVGKVPRRSGSHGSDGTQSRDLCRDRANERPAMSGNVTTCRPNPPTTWRQITLSVRGMYVLSTSTRARRRQDSLLPHAKASPSRLFVDAVEIRPKRKLRTEVTRRPHLARSKRVAAVFVPSRTFPRAWHEIPESTRWPFSPGDAQVPASIWPAEPSPRVPSA